MSTQPINDGGPAFPMPAHEDHWGTPHSATSGMTLRDYFAGQAMQGFAADGAFGKGTVCSIEDCARDAYDVADAMLAARSRP